MLIVQDIHVVAGRAELPFEDTYRDEIAPALGDAGARLAYFGWSPHGAGTGYEAIVLTAVDDVDGLLAYQDALAEGALADQWRSLEAGTRSLQSTLVVPVGGDLAIGEADPAVEGPRTLFRLDTLHLDGAPSAAAEQLAGASGTDGDLLERVVCLAPALGDLAAAEVSVLSRISSFDDLRTALDDLAGDAWSGAPDVPGVVDREVRISRCADFSPIH